MTEIICCFKKNKIFFETKKSRSFKNIFISSKKLQFNEINFIGKIVLDTNNSIGALANLIATTVTLAAIA